MSPLRKIGIFKALPDEDLKAVEPLVRQESRKKKEVIFREGDPPDWFYMVSEGRVKITRLSPDGKEIILEIIGEGDFFGGVAVIQGLPYPANAAAMEDAKLLKISRAGMEGVLKKFPPVMDAVFRSLGGRLISSHEHLKSIATGSVVSRIAALLVELARKSSVPPAPEGILIDMKLTKQDMAEMVGTTVETAIRTMSRLKKEGVLEEKKGMLVIKDLARLKALSSGG